MVHYSCYGCFMLPLCKGVHLDLSYSTWPRNESVCFKVPGPLWRRNTCQHARTHTHTHTCWRYEYALSFSASPSALPWSRKGVLSNPGLGNMVGFALLHTVFPIILPSQGSGIWIKNWLLRFEINIYILLYAKLVNNKDPLYNIGTILSIL